MKKFSIFRAFEIGLGRLGPIFSVAIIMIFVSCTNINKYVRNYQDCLTLVGSSEYRDFSNSDPFSSGRSA
jgi:hypothetical protein